jgi:endonuclease-8
MSTARAEGLPPRFESEAAVPEGDTVHGAADRLNEALAGQLVVRAAGSHRAMIEYGTRIVGSEIVSATAHGKHLLIDFTNGWTLRTHLQMTGQWHIYAPGERWRKTPGKARAVIETAATVAVCFAAPTVQLAPRRFVARRLANLGPDLMQQFDVAETASRVLAMGGSGSICDTILDQSIVAGIGNVYKSEVLFLEGIHPDTPTEQLEPETIAALLVRAGRLLEANRGRNRTTTGSRRPGNQTWVYGRGGRECRRCATTIKSAVRGPLERATYWCPRCQPAGDPA